MSPPLAVARTEPATVDLEFRPLPFVSHASEHIIAILSISSLHFASHPNP
jgi:hypothetical protein